VSLLYPLRVSQRAADPIPSDLGRLSTFGQGRSWLLRWKENGREAALQGKEETIRAPRKEKKKRGQRGLGEGEKGKSRRSLLPPWFAHEEGRKKGLAGERGGGLRSRRKPSLKSPLPLKGRLLP